jgi:hypothetical protein
MVAHRTFETRDRSFEDRASKLPRSATQSPDTLPERMPAIDALPRAPSIPVLGSIPAYFRDPLAFFLEAGRRGSVVDLRFPTGRAFHIGDPADIEYVVVTSNKSLVKDATLRDPAKASSGGGSVAWRSPPSTATGYARTRPRWSRAPTWRFGASARGRSATCTGTSCG